MSKENIAKFHEALVQKPELLEKLKDARTPEAVVAAAKAEGFDFTVEELAKSGKAAVPTRKLADEALGQVAGGMDTGCANWMPYRSAPRTTGDCDTCMHFLFAFSGSCRLKSKF